MNPNDEKDKALHRKEMFLKYKEELEANTTLQQLLERSYPNNRSKFVEDFAREKVSWMEYGDFHKKWVERENLQWVEAAHECLDQILQKKLFDVQCLWRAEQWEHPAVQVSSDFTRWEFNIRNCPFIEPITENDIDIYLQYLQSNNFEREIGFMEGWQDYLGIVDTYKNEDANSNVPEWYDFHNGRTGLGIYMTLPDVRGQKEEFYLSLWREKFHKQRAENQRKATEAQQAGTPIKAQEGVDTRPHLSYHQDDWMNWFVTTFEDKETIAKYQSTVKRSEDSDYDEWLENDLATLLRADRPVPIDGWFDWKEAIHRCAARYSQIRIAEAMPEAFEQYRINVDLGLGFDVPNHGFSDIKNWYHNGVLDGREINGEPRDFNF
jgi:hypothetical protein